MRTAPTAAPPLRRLSIPASILLVALIVWTWFHLFTRIRLEDAHITYRYASNLAGGIGFVYNAGERVLGTTTPLFTLALGLVGAALGQDLIPAASNILMAAAAAVAALLTAQALRRLSLPRPLSWLVMAALCLNPEIVWFTCGGMETPLVLMLMAAGLWALSRGSPLLAATSAALLAMTRIDGAIWAAGVCAVIVLKDRRALPRAALLGLLVTVPWVTFAASYFGSPMPHSVIAKRVIGPANDLLSLEHAREFLAWSAPFVGASLPGAWPAGLALFVAGAVRLLRREAFAERWLLVAFPLLFPMALYLGRSPLYFDWYLAPVVYCSVIVGCAGAWSVGERAVASVSRLRRPACIVLGIAAAVCLALAARQMARTAAFHRDYQTNEDGTRRAVGEWLAASTPEDAVVAMEAIGYQGHYSRRRIIDLAGLVSPSVVELKRQSWSNAEAFHRILNALTPDYLVLRSFEVDRNAHYHGGRLFETDAHAAHFAARYQEVRRFTAPLPELWGPTSYLTIYRRREAPDHEESRRSQP